MISIKSKVIKGKGLGEKIGFPTANIKIADSEVVHPNLSVRNKLIQIENAVYKVNVIIDGEKFKGAGVFLEQSGELEVHIFNFNKNIYGKSIEIILLRKIRNNQKFSNHDALVEQIKKDISLIKSIEITGITFGTFDKFHKGHEYYLMESSKYCDILITIVAKKNTVIRIKGKSPKHNEQERLKYIQDSGLSSKTMLGKDSNPYWCIDEFRPDVICLGYDQISFTDGLTDHLKDINLDSYIITIRDHEPHIYKSSKL